jgi:lipoate synthase
VTAHRKSKSSIKSDTKKSTGTSVSYSGVQSVIELSKLPKVSEESVCPNPQYYPYDDSETENIIMTKLSGMINTRSQNMVC